MIITVNPSDVDEYYITDAAAVVVDSDEVRIRRDGREDEMLDPGTVVVVTDG